MATSLQSASARTKVAPPVPTRAHLSRDHANPQSVNVMPMVMLTPMSPAPPVELRAPGVSSSQGQPVAQAHSVESQFGGISRRPNLPISQQQPITQSATALSTFAGPSTNPIELQILQQPTQDKSLEVRLIYSNDE